MNRVGAPIDPLLVGGALSTVIGTTDFRFAEWLSFILNIEAKLQIFWIKGCCAFKPVIHLLLIVPYLLHRKK
jgi:hypothetical protein